MDTSDGIIQFNASVHKVQTLADFGIRITLDLPQDSIDTAAKLMEVRANGGFLSIAAVPIAGEKANDNAGYLQHLDTEALKNG